ncbi:RNA polymerase sigma factor [Streptomyces aureus]|uniref:RNA polymerase sigma factor n=1 Tax=Streptomyces aureus TaxID=193461 RepID=UPI0006E2DF32|nr:sigma-70 family RNA polymerase sigma factor [Streptomyces aureus]
MSDEEFDGEVIALFALHGDSMHRRLLTSGVPADEAETILQDAFLAVRRQWARSRDEHPEAYARKVTWYLRQAYWKTVYQDRELAQKLAREYEEARVSADEEVIASIVVHEALQMLPERQASVVKLRHLHQLSVAEVSTTLGIAEGTVKRHCHDGLRALRRALEQEPDGRGGDQ